MHVLSVRAPCILLPRLIGIGDLRMPHASWWRSNPRVMDGDMVIVAAVTVLACMLYWVRVRAWGRPNPG